jgi:hypothetical protein
MFCTLLFHQLILGVIFLRIKNSMKHTLLASILRNLIKLTMTIIFVVLLAILPVILIAFLNPDWYMSLTDTGKRLFFFPLVIVAVVVSRKVNKRLSVTEKVNKFVGVTSK